MIRVAFTLIGGKNWTGGYNYLLNLIQTLAIYKKDIITPVIFISDDNKIDFEVFTDMPGVEVVTSNLFRDKYNKSLLLQALIFGRSPALVSLFMKHRIDVVFEAAQFFGWRLGLPAIAWIPDFQHRSLPHLFSKSLWWKREFGFRAQINANRTIMLSSNNARNDCERYYPQTRGRTYTIHFSVPIETMDDFKSARAIADFYELPDNFIFLPNQFWVHKNHLLVIDALRILRDRGIKVVIAASGKQYDPRAPDYFPSLVKKISEYELMDWFRLLGLIPYAHVKALMRCCQAMLNPSLFEGWSTTVEEARAIATPMLLSDLDVHREQMGLDAQYFSRASAKDLADLIQATPQFNSLQRYRLLNAARDESQSRMNRFAEDFASLIRDAKKVCSK